MIYIGNHVSVTAGYEAMGREELTLGGNTFAFFPRNPRGGRSKPVKPEDIEALKVLLEENGFGRLVVHGAYTMNLCSSREDVRGNSIEMMRDDLILLQDLPGNYYNFHPGSHTGQGIETGTDQIAHALASIIEQVEGSTGRPIANRILLETMSGKGSEVGGRFEDLKIIIDKFLDIAGAERSKDIGVCLDTCHIWDGGYDIKDDLDGVLAEFDRVIGLGYLHAVHLNDSKNKCGSHKDRHEKLGEGTLGNDALKRVVRHPLLQDKPFILETPNDDEGYRKEIAAVKSWITAR
ncbi:MAG: deoxyribonuclease IV [Mogibacterium sp.]|nr:deoxyribonuclease IV [Mogibacterium sp.]